MRVRVLVCVSVVVDFVNARCMHTYVQSFVCACCCFGGVQRNTTQQRYLTQCDNTDTCNRPDDIESIQTKTVSMEGYKARPCSWRGAEAFSPRSPYNLCLPLRPRTL